jgi:hypothetical protein
VRKTDRIDKQEALTFLRAYYFAPRDETTAHTVSLEVFIRKLVILDGFKVKFVQGKDRIAQIADGIEILEKFVVRIKCIFGRHSFTCNREFK